MVTSGEESAGWTPYVVALAQAVQTAVLRASLRSFVLFAVLDAEIFARPSAGDRPKARSIRGASFVLTTTPSRVIEGTVREQGTGQPVAGAMVNGLWTDHVDKFRIDGLSPEFILPLEVAGPVGAAYFQNRAGACRSRRTPGKPGRRSFYFASTTRPPKIGTTQ
jgi:hypothetical protein